jgi:hypothetical protein
MQRAAAARSGGSTEATDSEPKPTQAAVPSSISKPEDRKAEQAAAANTSSSSGSSSQSLPSMPGVTPDMMKAATDMMRNNPDWYKQVGMATGWACQLDPTHTWRPVSGDGVHASLLVRPWGRNPGAFTALNLLLQLPNQHCCVATIGLSPGGQHAGWDVRRAAADIVKQHGASGDTGPDSSRAEQHGAHGKDASR